MALTIRQWRRVKDLSQEQMANDLGVTRQTIANWENKPELLSIAAVSRIAEYFGVAFGDIRFDATEDNKTSSEETK